jgi:uncharacterized circularly permuted ATP-grasp superfamily protein
MPLALDEMYTPDGAVRPAYAALAAWLDAQPPERIAQDRRAADLLFHKVGITFAVYGEGAGTERLIPFDIIPHVIPGTRWNLLEQGLKQRVRALNLFCHDVYHQREILRAGKVPEAWVLENSQFRAEMIGVNPPGGIYSHIAGIDVIKAADGEYYVLEDNLRTPSGVSYMLENRRMMMRLYPELFTDMSVRPVEHYPDLLLDTLRAASPRQVEDPTIVLLTPGIYNSAYFEHAFLAQQMGIELVEGQDLVVEGQRVYMRTTKGRQRVDVVYRRIDDDFLDPQTFRADSMLGVPGLFEAYRAGHVALANAVGTGIADDKSIYPFVPEMIRFYLGEEPLLRNVHTWICGRPDDLRYVLAHLPELVVKEAQGSGGYGMLIGPKSTREDIESFRRRLIDAPERYIAQPTLDLSTVPTYAGSELKSRHVDLRPFILSREGDSRMVAGGLTRVAMKEGSLVVNSSQGGGVKDTWVLD